MNENGPLDLLDVREQVNQSLDIVAVDRADVGKTHLLEQQPRMLGRRKMRGGALCPLRRLAQDAATGKACEYAFGRMLGKLVHRLDAKLGEVGGESADIFRYRHLVVVQDYGDVGAVGGRVVHPFESQSAG